MLTACLCALAFAAGSADAATERKQGTRTASKPATHATTNKKAAQKPSKKTAGKTGATSKGTAKSSNANPPIQADPQQARALEEERTALKEKLAQLKRDIAAGESTRSEVADQLASSERAISDVNRKLRDLNGQQSKVQDQLTEIGQRRGDTQNRITAQQNQLGGLLRQQYLSGTQDPFRLMFSGEDPNRIQRDLTYLSYVSQAQAEILRDLQGNLDQLRKISQETEQRNAELNQIAEQQESSRATLVKEQETRRATLASISTKLQAQRREAGALERDEQRLGKVVEEIARLLARQAAEVQEREKKQKERERELARERQKQSAQQNAQRGLQQRENLPNKPEEPGDGKTTPGPQNSLTPQASSGSFNGNFAVMKGQLRLPVAGELTARFGATRSSGGPSWKGIFIRSQEGAEVKAIAPGRVVFAEWLRGFGNLLIIDHGQQYLSIYGNNEALLKQPGDTVKTGDVLATVGNSGGNPETGLYFELRYQGRPFDPLSWAKLR